MLDSVFLQTLCENLQNYDYALMYLTLLAKELYMIMIDNDLQRKRNVFCIEYYMGEK